MIKAKKNSINKRSINLIKNEEEKIKEKNFNIFL